ncbi:MAG: hypothetical protein U0166_24550 [Acidobacteriota bacterium]
MRSAIEEAIDAFGLGPYRVRGLRSRGTCMKLTQFARAQALDAELLFLDETLLRMSPSASSLSWTWLRWRVDEGRAARWRACGRTSSAQCATRVVEHTRGPP